MTETGWEILPPGWLVLIVLGLVLILAAIQWLQDRRTNNS